MAGVGKTQLAVEYAYRFAGAYELAWWVPAEGPTLIPGQLARLAVEKELVLAAVPPAEGVTALLRELRTAPVGCWCSTTPKAPSPYLGDDDMLRVMAAVRRARLPSTFHAISPQNHHVFATCADLLGHAWGRQAEICGRCLPVPVAHGHGAAGSVCGLSYRRYRRTAG